MKNQFVLSLLANVLRVAFGFVFFWQVSQALNLDELGEYLYVISSIGYFGTLIDYGFNLFVLNTASRSEGAVRPLFLRVVLSKLVLTATAGGILSAIYAFAFVEQGVAVTVLFFAGLVLQSFSGLLIHFYKALGRFDHEFTSTLLASTLPVVLLLVTGDELTIQQLGWIVLEARLAVILFQMVLFLRATEDQPWTVLDGLFVRMLPGTLKDIGGNFKYAVFSVLGAIFLSVDLVIMRFTLGSEAVSIYGTAMKLVLAAILFFEVLNGTFIPRLARCHETVTATGFFRESRHFLLVMLGLSVFFSAGLLVVGPMVILQAFGAEFAESGEIVRVLAIVFILRVMEMTMGPLLTVFGLQGFRARAMTIVLPLHIAANLLLQSRFGVWGAVGALAFSFLLLFALNSAYFLRAIRTKTACE